MVLRAKGGESDTKITEEEFLKRFIYLVSSKSRFKAHNNLLTDSKKIL